MEADGKENVGKTEKTVNFNRQRAFSENNVPFERETLRVNEDISPDLERYIRRYVGLPAMLKAGEYSPNNPLIRGERTSGDVLLGLGEYERRRNTLRKIRQRQYKEYLDEQAKIKQEAKEKAEKERREREERDRLRDKREKERLELERDVTPEPRRSSVSHTYVSGSNNTYITKVDTGVQVDHRSSPLSVAVQTDDDELFRLTPPAHYHKSLTQAERELSPHTVDKDTTWEKWGCERRRSYGDFDERTSSLLKKTTRDKLTSDLRHTYMPSIFDAEAIKLRNEQAEKEAAERRQYYQQELKNQILEQQRIKEERKTREKMLEQAEMRRLEEQLRSLKMAQEREIERQHDVHTALTENTTEYEKKRKILQKEIDLEHKALLKAAIHPKHTHTSKSESSQLFKDRPPYSTNIPEKSIFSPNYDVESYLRKNLNPIDILTPKISSSADKLLNEAKEINKIADTLPIPVLRHSPKRNVPEETMSDLSEKMQIVDDKWRVPAVQKNILKSLNDKGKNVSILTQLGSIRRQLQLEQLKLDKMLSKTN